MLFWGILGALVMRGVMIGVGVALITLVDWVLYLFGAFLVFTGVKMLFVQDRKVQPEKNRVVRLGAETLSRRARVRRAEIPHAAGKAATPSPRWRWCCCWWKPPI